MRLAEGEGTLSVPKLSLRGLSHTKKPTGTLMLQIPIRTFSEWHNVPVGTLGMDELVPEKRTA